MRLPGRHQGALSGHRVYLSGPMGFVASRDEEMRLGWRNRVGQFLQSMGVTVLNPWNKPRVKWFDEYGQETRLLQEMDRKWDPLRDRKSKRHRAECAEKFKETMHVDLRMVDTSDFVIAYCPTNIYSVGTVHEIVLASQQHKPVLVVCPPIQFPTLNKLRACLADLTQARKLLSQLEKEVPIKSNATGRPSPWYMALLGEHSFFDGFGFPSYVREFNWQQGPIDKAETDFPPKRPLLPYVEQINLGKSPTRFDIKVGRDVKDADWLLLEEAVSAGRAVGGHPKGLL